MRMYLGIYTPRFYYVHTYLGTLEVYLYLYLLRWLTFLRSCPRKDTVTYIYVCMYVRMYVRMYVHMGGVRSYTRQPQPTFNPKVPGHYLYLLYTLPPLLPILPLLFQHCLRVIYL